eukprot:TRINITY_DN2875_c0_g1::TRINITY_DN2875_c0_g1_i1::g.6023::m.6023 TRINITY_DN2875_c0_g1::TRINITY_DN2875_c0_g1_i1::g.6023  ORF type:complete len:406 (-),score=68.45,sp/Q61555/FBN2_MOUSE/41.77/2e-32,sp/Q61555/FBN2_MOUSE/40.12/4e-23,sp/Q61555/FBN2_MOUSE/39.02/2e-22,sp/Q61555/FBN2_MOUSE/37.20/5e-19,sp/Q61555/FBN2_MOUSE/35.00/5e-19,sp/Q61555/FBN2_MOUSE/32.78/2e-18,sp/Q61555/FBN2_MOUSE/36.14/3e-17,sp/Q61555/FBN2_MOUSE/31.75/9e-17,sp/Q61555/FBN2_MOUSE/36.65/2e-16,sp/Q61555/FBN2_MOUSE/32.53/1e-14,sp/Q61555/F
MSMAVFQASALLLFVALLLASSLPVQSFGAHHRRTEDVNECTMNLHNCGTHGTCSNTAGSFTCTCHSGYQPSTGAVACTNENECTLSKHNCGTNAACTDTDGAFSCSCNAGYSGNGLSCANIDECIQNTDNCHADAICTDTPGSFTCSCNSGFSGDGTACANINECHLNADNCHADATCTDTVGSFTCACSAGYYGDGVSYCVTCTEITGCADCSREALQDVAAYPRIAACSAPWSGTKSLRAPRSAGSPMCGNDVECSSPADACAVGWHVCGDNGIASELTSSLTSAHCRSNMGTNSRFLAAMSHVRESNIPSRQCSASTDAEGMECFEGEVGSQPVCCGSLCISGGCIDGIWPCVDPDPNDSSNTCDGTYMENTGQSCNACLSPSRDGVLGGVLCCKDIEGTP